MDSLQIAYYKLPKVQLKASTRLQLVPVFRFEGCMEVMKHTSKGIHPGFETQGRRHLKSKTGVIVASPKRTNIPIIAVMYVSITKMCNYDELSTLA